MIHCETFPDATWKLVAITSWVIEFLEGIAKECVLATGSSTSDPEVKEASDLFGSAPCSYIYPIREPMLMILDSFACRYNYAAINGSTDIHALVSPISNNTVD